MFLQRILNWLGENFKFVAVNGLSHLVAGFLIPTMIYPFLNKAYQKRINYFLLVFFPAVFGSIFPDLLFAISTFIKSQGLKSWSYLLKHGGEIHSVFHRDIALALVIPTTVFLIIVMVYLINFVKYLFGKGWKQKYVKIKLDELPGKWLLWCSVISFFGAGLHILMDVVGF
tara:strand:+ start:22 stop:534 length:513 start_codon:yes stop_codon:yes gene_type:complete